MGTTNTRLVRSRPRGGLASDELDRIYFQQAILVLGRFPKNDEEIYRNLLEVLQKYFC